ncbi:MAG: MerR family transcriptional regulator [bacterium]
MHSIKAVSQITGLKAYVLRFWETEFEELRPAKSSGGSREYSVDDIKLIFLIKRLLYEEKYTIEGARQRMQAMKKDGQQMDLSFERLRREDAIFEIKKGLQELLVFLDQPRPKAANSRAAGKVAKSGISSPTAAATKKERASRSSSLPARHPASRAHAPSEVPLFPEESISP